MFGVASASKGLARYSLVGLAIASVGVLFPTDRADARRSHRTERSSNDSPAFASIMVDANSGATLQATNADNLRHPASLTKIMTLYMLFERLESGKIKLDSQMDISQRAAEQAPTKLGLQRGQTLGVEDAIKGLVTRSANDAAVVIAEALAGDEGEFAKAMTRKARALGMSKTVYKNASGLPDNDQVTTARDQATLGRAIQDRFPKYYRYFATAAFNYRGRVIRNHNKLLGHVEGVDGIKTGYTQASGFNLVTSMRRGNRHLVGVVLGGRSGGSRDVIMRNLLVAHFEKGAPKRTVAAITERNPDARNPDTRIAEAKPNRQDKVAAAPQRTQIIQSQGSAQLISVTPASPPESAAPTKTTVQPSDPSKPTPVPLTSGVITTPPLDVIPGSSEPMSPVRVKTVQVRMGQTKVIAAEPATPAPVATSSVSVPNSTPDIPATPKPAVATPAIATEVKTTDVRDRRPEFPAPLPSQPNTSNGIGQGTIGIVSSSLPSMPATTVPVTTVPATAVPSAATSSSAIPSRAISSSAMAYTDPSPRGMPPTTLAAQAQALQVVTSQTSGQQTPAPAMSPSESLKPAAQQQQAIIQQPTPQPAQQNATTKSSARSGWIIQVGALDSENEARQRLEAARASAQNLLGRANSFTEVVAKGDKKLYRARFTGLDKDSAEAVCRKLKRSDITCITIRN